MRRGVSVVTMLGVIATTMWCGDLAEARALSPRQAPMTVPPTSVPLLPAIPPPTTGTSTPTTTPGNCNGGSVRCVEDLHVRLLSIATNADDPTVQQGTLRLRFELAATDSNFFVGQDSYVPGTILFRLSTRQVLDSCPVTRRAWARRVTRVWRSSQVVASCQVDAVPSTWAGSQKQT